MKERLAGMVAEKESSTFAAQVVGGRARPGPRTRRGTRRSRRARRTRETLGTREAQRQVAAGDQRDARHDQHVAHAAGRNTSTSTVVSITPSAAGMARKGIIVASVAT